MNEGTYFLFKSEKKTDEGHLKQMGRARETINFFFALVFRQEWQTVQTQISLGAF